MPTAGDADDGLSGGCGIGDLPSAEYSFSSSDPLERWFARDALDAKAAAVAASDSSMVPV